MPTPRFRLRTALMAVAAVGLVCGAEVATRDVDAEGRALVLALAGLLAVAGVPLLVDLLSSSWRDWMPAPPSRNPQAETLLWICEGPRPRLPRPAERPPAPTHLGFLLEWAARLAILVPVMAYALLTTEPPDDSPGRREAAEVVREVLAVSCGTCLLAACALLLVWMWQYQLHLRHEDRR